MDMACRATRCFIYEQGIRCGVLAIPNLEKGFCSCIITAE